MWVQTDGWPNQYRRSIAYYLIYFLSKLHQIYLDKDVDTPGHGKYVVDDFNDVQKQYLSTCLKIWRTPEVDKIDSKRMRVDAMTKKGGLSFSEYCKCLLDICDEVGTKGDKKHEKREAKARLNHKQYWVHKEGDILFNGMKAVYKILNNRDKVKMKHFYHIRCDPDLGKGFCDMRRIPCACTGWVEQLFNTWLPNRDKTLQPRYDTKPETCKYFYILHGYNKWYIFQIDLKKETTNLEEMDIKDEFILNGTT